MYGFEAMSINQWHGVVYKNDSLLIPIPVGDPALERFDFDPVSILISSGTKFRNFLFFFQDDFGFDLWMIFVLAIFYRIIAFILLFVKTLKKRN